MSLSTASQLSPAERHSMGDTLGRSALLAAAYIVAGWLGLQLAAPPGYVTLVWPASGIALAALIMFGPRLALGVLVGSFALNAYVGDAFENGAVDWTSAAVAAGIAAGSMLQAVVAAFAARKIFGVPLALKNKMSLLLLTLLVGPLACVIAASIGVGTLYFAGAVPAQAALSNWLTWWSGDLIGILIVLPIAFLAPWRPWSVRWLGKPVAGLTLASVIALLIPMGLTFYAWRATSEVSFERNSAAFERLAEDSERALRHRLESYAQSLDGAAGLIGASDRVTANDWRIYVESLDIGATLPGINGIGVIKPVETRDMARFLQQAREDGVENLSPHPETKVPENFIIRYIEPLDRNLAAVGLNIAFENNRHDAAVQARDSGEATITKRIFLVQDATRSAGFLLLRPFYRQDMPLLTIDDRRRAFLGWVYAPFISINFMDQLTASQGASLNLRVFDGSGADPDQLIYASSATPDVEQNASYTVTKRFPVFGQTWTLEWESTPEFDASISTRESLLVLLGGGLLTAIFGVYLLSFARREEAVRRMVDQKTREIAAREEQNRSVVDTAVVAILLLDGDGRVLSANRAADGMFGFADDEIIQQEMAHLLGFGSGEDALRELLMFALSVTPEGYQQEALEVVRPDGTPIHINLQLNSWQTEAGEERFTAIVRDVSLETQMTSALEEAERRWSMALRGAEIGVFDIDLVRGTSIVSETWKEMLGFGSTENINPQAEWESRVHPDDRQMVELADKACFAGRSPRSEVEYRLRHKDGGWIWLRSNGMVTERDASGEALRFVGTQTDITDLKLAEAAVRASEERFRSAIENAPIATALLDLEGQWLKVNDAACKFVGYQQDELMSLKFQSITHPDDLKSDKESIRQLLRGEIETYQLEKRYIHKNGKIVWALLSVSLARDEAGTPAYFIAQILDITHRREMDRLQGEFVSNVSHELRTPLTSIRGSLGLLEGTMSSDLPAPAKRLVSIAHKNSERLSRLINDILDLEKLSADKIPFEFENQDVGDQVRQAAEANQGYADQLDVSYVIDVPDEPLVASLDKQRLQQILSNLMSNAAKYSPTGGQVRVEVAENNGNVRVSVIDEGPGIPQNFRSSIFQPFSQADGSATREKGGTGLGLHITKQMVERMQGSVDYTSIEGLGTTFWIEFPLVQSDAAKVVPTPAGSSHLKALHIEDDADFNTFLAAALEEHMDVSSALSLSKARKMLEENEYDVIIADLQLGDGLALELFDDAPQFKEKPVVVVSASEQIMPDPRVAAWMVKSRMPESLIVDTIVSAVARDRKVFPGAVGRTRKRKKA